MSAANEAWMPVEISAELVDRTYKALKLKARREQKGEDGTVKIIERTEWVPFALVTWSGKGRWSMPAFLAKEKGFA